ncbi:MAG: peptidoglycan DD-metalloendopeptidase family protein [Patescibacteria group bacterium]
MRSHQKELLTYVGVFLLSFIFSIVPALIAQADQEELSLSGKNSQNLPVFDGSNAQWMEGQGGAYIQVVENTLVVDTSSINSQVTLTQEGGEQGSAITTYTVAPGDTISEIAERFSVSQNTIIWANDLRGTSIRVGQELVILPISGVLHTVESGDTLSELAKYYKADLRDIESYNGFEDSSDLQIGEKITIPYGSIPAPRVTVTSSSRSSSQTTTSKANDATAQVWNNTRTIWSNGVRTTPLRNTGGPNYDSYYSKPIVGYSRSRGLHGNNAVDWAAPQGTVISAAQGGTVSIAKYGGWNGGYGKYVVINHSNGTQTLYAHMSSVQVLPGDTVVVGQTIGLVGTTGNSTGNHLHFEVRGARNPWR